jgi:hypothetical protein
MQRTVAKRRAPRLTPRQKSIIRSFGLPIADDSKRAHYEALVSATLATMPQFTDSDVAFTALVAAEEKQNV